jgi:hypothetical protein
MSNTALELGESLDRSHTGAVSHARLRCGESNDIVLDIKADHDPQLELWGVQNHQHAFQKVFKRKLVIEAAVHNPRP